MSEPFNPYDPQQSHTKILEEFDEDEQMFIELLSQYIDDFERLQNKQVGLTLFFYPADKSETKTKGSAITWNGDGWRRTGAMPKRHNRMSKKDD